MSLFVTGPSSIYLYWFKTFLNLNYHFRYICILEFIVIVYGEVTANGFVLFDVYFISWLCLMIS